MGRHVFVSHSKQNRQAADAVCHALEAEGIRCWIAPRDVPPGQRWATAIVHAVKDSSAMVLLFSSGTAESSEVFKELRLAADFRVPILPVRIEDAEPRDEWRFELCTYHWLDAFPLPLDRYFGSLIESVHRLAGDAIGRLDRAAADGQAEAIAPGTATPQSRPPADPVECSPDASASSPVHRLTWAPTSAFPGMVRIEAGEFQMGSPDSDGEKMLWECPQHLVRITRAFELSVTPVTQDLYRAVTGKNPSHFKGDDRPVETVFWRDAAGFCNALSRLEGLPEAYRIGWFSVEWNRGASGYRLPTEAEWEYACRAGTPHPRYGDLDAIAWYQANSGNETHSVRGKAPNPWGLHDMLGNVAEWVWDRTRSPPPGDGGLGDLQDDVFDFFLDCAGVDWGFYTGAAVSDPIGPSVGGARRTRGGSWLDKGERVRAANRSRADAGTGRSDRGFRLARSLLDG